MEECDREDHCVYGGQLCAAGKCVCQAGYDVDDEGRCRSHNVETTETVEIPLVTKAETPGVTIAPNIDTSGDIWNITLSLLART